MSLILPGNVASATASTGYDVDNSCRFNDDDSAYLSRTQASGSTTKFTYSAWMKRGKLTDAQDFLDVYNDNNNRFGFFWNDDDQIDMYNKISGSVNFQKITTAKYRDPSAWYHVVIAADTTLGTAEDRIKLWVNGVRVTSFGTNTNPGSSVNFSIHSSSHEQRIGSYGTGSSYYDGLYAEVFWIDGTAYDQDDFGEFDEDSPTIWKPKDCKDDLTFGTNGFYLDFADSGDLGDDESGNGNDFTENNIAAVDQGTDSPTNNFCTMNPLAYRLDSGVSKPTYSEGNCKLVLADDSGASKSSMGTIGVTTGLWYWEMKLTTDNDAAYCGITRAEYDPNDNFGGRSIYYNSANGALSVGTGTGGTADGSYGNTYTSGDIVGVAFDATNGVIWFSKAGTWQNSATIAEIGAGTTTNAATTGITMSQFWMPFLEGADCTWEVNLGGSPAFTVSSGNADGNGYGNFEYAVPSGYYALCTKNLAEYG